MGVTQEMIQAVREHECSLSGHDWQVIESVGFGPVMVVCVRCGKNSGLRRVDGEV